MDRGTRIGFAICILLVSAGIATHGQTAQPFSADVTVNAEGPVMNGKFYFAPPKMRVDVTSMEQAHGNNPFGGNIAMIIDGSTKTTIMLLPQKHMYMEMPATVVSDTAGLERLQDLSRGSNPCKGQTGLSCKKIGAETIGGRSCDKWETADTEGNASTVWIDQKLNFPIRVVNKNGSTTSFTNINEGTPDASLFVIPPGYRKFNASALGGGK